MAGDGTQKTIRFFAEIEKHYTHQKHIEIGDFVIDGTRWYMLIDLCWFAKDPKLWQIDYRKTTENRIVVQTIRNDFPMFENEFVVNHQISAI